LNNVHIKISKGQGYQGFPRKRAGSSFGQKRAIASYKEKLMEFLSLFEWAGPWEVKGHKGAHWWQKGAEPF
jgi:hypothetical protein